MKRHDVRFEVWNDEEARKRDEKRDKRCERRNERRNARDNKARTHQYA